MHRNDRTNSIDLVSSSVKIFTVTKLKQNSSVYKKCKDIWTVLQTFVKSSSICVMLNFECCLATLIDFAKTSGD